MCPFYIVTLLSTAPFFEKIFVYTSFIWCNFDVGQIWTKINPP